MSVTWSYFRCLLPWIRKTLWRRKCQPTPVFLPGKSHGQRSLEGYSPQDHKRVRHDSNWATTHIPTTHTILVLEELGQWGNNSGLSYCSIKVVQVAPGPQVIRLANVGWGAANAPSNMSLEVCQVAGWQEGWSWRSETRANLHWSLPDACWEPSAHCSDTLQGGRLPDKT